MKRLKNGCIMRMSETDSAKEFEQRRSHFYVGNTEAPKKTDLTPYKTESYWFIVILRTLLSLTVSPVLHTDIPILTE